MPAVTLAFDPPVTGREITVVAGSLEDGRDRELVRRVGDGDEEAFRTLFRRYGPVAKALAARVLRQPHLAEEIVQEAFLVLWRSPDSYREDRGTVRGWLMSTVHHRAVDMVRREEAHRRRLQTARGDEAQPDVGQQVVDLTDLAESRERIRAALADIPPEQRQARELMYF